MLCPEGKPDNTCKKNHNINLDIFFLGDNPVGKSSTDRASINTPNDKICKQEGYSMSCPSWTNYAKHLKDLEARIQEVDLKFITFTTHKGHRHLQSVDESQLHQFTSQPGPLFKCEYSLVLSFLNKKKAKPWFVIII